MKKVILRNLLLIIILAITSQLFGQETEAFKRTDVVYLRNGSIFRGQIEFYEIGRELHLRLDAKKVIVFKARNIRKIVQEASASEESKEKAVIKKAYAFREQGIYYAANLGYIGGNDLFGNYTHGYNAHFLAGYQIERIIGAGIGMGIDFYNVDLGSILPVYAEVRGYLKESNVSPFYQIAGGYGFPITSEDSGFTDKKGGTYIAPAIGIRFGGSSEDNFTMSLGLQWQKAKYRNDFDDGISNIEDSYTFRRFNLKIGVIF